MNLPYALIFLLPSHVAVVTTEIMGKLVGNCMPVDYTKAQLLLLGPTRRKFKFWKVFWKTSNSSGGLLFLLRRLIGGRSLLLPLSQVGVACAGGEVDAVALVCPKYSLFEKLPSPFPAILQNRAVDFSPSRLPCSCSHWNPKTENIRGSLLLLWYAWYELHTRTSYFYHSFILVTGSLCVAPHVAFGCYHLCRGNLTTFSHLRWHLWWCLLNQEYFARRQIL